MDNDKLYKNVHNYTKFKLVEMLINRLNDGKTKMDNMNSIEDLVDDILKIISICGMKYYSELKGTFDELYNTLDILFYNSNRFMFYVNSTFVRIVLPCDKNKNERIKRKD